MEQLRSLYYQAVEDESAIALGLAQVDSLRNAGFAAPGQDRDGVLTAYRGALITLRAKHGFWPPDRLKHLREGLRIMDAAVAAHPEVAEVRYLRLMSCFYLPGILYGIVYGLALLGSLAVCVTAGLLARLDWMQWLRWLGEHSIVVYLSFSIPMAVTRMLLLKLGLVTDTGVLGTIVLLVALTGPLLLYALVRITGWGRFLFERPAWAHLPGTPGSRGYTARTAATPAE